MITPEHGSMLCFDGFKLLSVCRFACERGYLPSGGNETLHCGNVHDVLKILTKMFQKVLRVNKIM